MSVEKPEEGAVECKLYPVTLSVEIDLLVAAPVGMSEDEVLLLVRKCKDEIVEEEDHRIEWTAQVGHPRDGDASDVDRHTYIVDDERKDLVHGEETAWLPDPGTAMMRGPR